MLAQSCASILQVAQGVSPGASVRVADNSSSSLSPVDSQE